MVIMKIDHFAHATITLEKMFLRFDYVEKVNFFEG